ncbi:MAG TPA: hypothetical protein VK779_01590 [Rhizomicrobium sp.]|jgi:hypothetical protein|nr:hypothetical protein [Rhizomicrobium sp.]
MRIPALYNAHVLAFLSRKEGPERQPNGAPGRLGNVKPPKLLGTMLRLVSLVLIVTALLLLGADMITSLERGGQLTVRSLGQIWAVASPEGLGHAHHWLDSHGGAGALNSLLTLPGWGVTGVLGVLFAFLFGRKAS